MSKERVKIMMVVGPTGFEPATIGCLRIFWIPMSLTLHQTKLRALAME